jgi:hypothetical protein
VYKKAKKHLEIGEKFRIFAGESSDTIKKLKQGKSLVLAF